MLATCVAAGPYIEPLYSGLTTQPPHDLTVCYSLHGYKRLKEHHYFI